MWQGGMLSSGFCTEELCQHSHIWRFWGIHAAVVLGRQCWPWQQSATKAAQCFIWEQGPAVPTTDNIVFASAALDILTVAYITRAGLFGKAILYALKLSGTLWLNKSSEEKYRGENTSTDLHTVMSIWTTGCSSSCWVVRLHCLCQSFLFPASVSQYAHHWGEKM